LTHFIFNILIKYILIKLIKKKVKTKKKPKVLTVLGAFGVSFLLFTNGREASDIYKDTVDLVISPRCEVYTTLKHVPALSPKAKPQMSEIEKLKGINIPFTLEELITVFNSIFSEPPVG